MFKLAVVSAVVITFSGVGSGQSVQEPQYNYEFHYIDGSNNLVPLEKAKFEMSGTKVDIEPKASPVRFSPASVPTFVVKGFPPSMNPSDVIALVKLKTTRKTRQAEYKVSGLGFGGFGLLSGKGVKVKKPEDDGIPLKFEPYGAESVKVVPGQPLLPGEYMFKTNFQPQFVFCFGVD